MKHGKIFIGTSGWHYKHWVGTFYPADTKTGEQFNLYKRSFATVEINNSFYRLPSAETFKAWRKDTPTDFVFSVKASRYITHMKKLKDPDASFNKFFNNVKWLKEKLGSILFQLPPSWKVNAERLEEFLNRIPLEFRYVFEFRNESWYREEVYALLRKFNCGFCIYELAGHRSPIELTADFVYVRLHGPGKKYEGSYTDSDLQEWAEQCSVWRHEGKDVFVYFDNDQNGYAPANGLTLVDLVANIKR